MKRTTETLNRATRETMERQPGEQMAPVRVVKSFRATGVSVTADGLALEGFATYEEPLSASVQSAPDGKHPVAS